MENTHLLSTTNSGDIVSQTSIKRKKNSLPENGGNRPYESVSSLSDAETGGQFSSGANLNPTPELYTYGGIKLGWIQGVLIPCLLNIWGVMLFLRIAWVVAQAGIGLTIVIICLSGVVCIITTLSLSAICTNGQLKGGGVYYIVSRSLGAEFGASVGIVFAFANAVAASMNTIGFCDSLNDLLKSHGLKIIDNSVNDTRIVGAIALFVMCFICAVGMDWETKTQNFLITVIVLAITNYIIGALIGPSSNLAVAKGFIGINSATAQKNWLPDFRFSEKREHDFFSVFAVYFPAVTGVQAGANICGDLRDPASAIPKGTLTALGISLTSYFTMAMLSGVGALRDASGDSSNITAAALEACKPDCEYGLHNNYEIMQLMALWGPLIYGGCWAATLSTALTNLLSVPRLIQALGVDRIYPGLIFFSKPYGKHGEPYRGYVLTFSVSLLFLLIADLNTIAPLITNFYLASYALINFCTFHAAFVEQISWRPTFRCYNKWLSLAGFLMCVTIMMIISWVMALTTIVIFMTLYLLVLYRKPEADWGSSTEGQRYLETVLFVLRLSRRAENMKSYNPQLLVLAGKAYARSELLDLGQFITKKVGSFMIVADIENEEQLYSERVTRCRVRENWLRLRKHRAFYILLQGYNFESGAKALMQTTGLGRLSPNLLLIGYKYKWRNTTNEELGSYFRVIQHAFDLQLAVAILRMPDTDLSKDDAQAATHPHAFASIPSDSNIVETDLLTADKQNDADTVPRQADPATPPQSSPPPQEVTASHNTLFKKSTSLNYKCLSLNRESCIDAWWFYDDGGLNILLPYIIAQRGYDEKLPLRIFAVAGGTHKQEDAKKYMEVLLAKYRIEYSKLTLVHGLGDTPSDDNWNLFNNIIKSFQNKEKKEIFISDTELKKQYAKTCRYLRMRELLMQHSSEASLIIIRLPYPRKGSASAALYMAWLEVLSQGLPPMLFLRGNESYVIDA